MVTLGIILARARSKGLPGKCVRELLGRPLIEYTFDHAKASKRLSGIVLTTDCEEAKVLARRAGIEVIDRPAELATDTATVDAAARHAVEEWERRRHEGTEARRHEGADNSDEATERRSDEGEGTKASRRTSGHEGTDQGASADVVVLLYGNIPVRRAELIDQAIEKLIQTGADSVRSVAPVTKQHPDWVHRLEGDRMVQFRPNSIYRRQDLEPLYYHDGAIVVVTRAALFGALQTPEDKQSFLGRDRRAIVCELEDAVDVDAAADLYLAEAILRRKADCQLPIANCQLASDRCVSVGERVIGRRARTFIIAEAGVNHNGNVETALRMVDEAARAGADAVKFQMFRAEELASADAPAAAYQREGCGSSSQREMLAPLELSTNHFERIAHRCRQAGIALVITPFGVEDVRRIEALNALGGQGAGDTQADRERGLHPVAHKVVAIKIASTDLTNVVLLEAAAKTGSPLIVSTGASTSDEIRAAVERLQRAGARTRFALLHCVSCYPTPIEAINLRAIDALGEEFAVPVGLSDHTTSTQTGGWAVAAGACMLEKHFTLDKSADGPDHAMSLTLTELAEYIRVTREAEGALGRGEIGPSEIEQNVRQVARKSVVAARPIAAGTPITAEMLTLKRPGTGIAPDRMAELVGRRASTDIPRDTLLSWRMVK